MSSALAEWIALYGQPENVWFIKRLSGNDTLLNGSHQAGPYVPKGLLFDVLPDLLDGSILNPRVTVEAFVDSHGEALSVDAIWYNGKLFGKTRNETRLTGWGGSKSAVLAPSSTGALAVFVFCGVASGKASHLRIWLCTDGGESDFEELVGPVDPGQFAVWIPGQQAVLSTTKSAKSSGARKLKLPSEWLSVFPTARDIVSKSVEICPLRSASADRRLLKRRECEFEIFRAVEEAVERQRIEQGFKTLSEFIGAAQTILQRRKARAGLSLELQAREIFIEEGLIENRDFSHGAVSEMGKRPDFLFPKQECYRDADFPAGNLTMLAAKTTVRDRWRQVLNEADRIPRKHLLTLQEGVTEGQFAEMCAANILLVVPRDIHKKYPKTVQQEILSLEAFIAEVREKKNVNLILS